MSLFNTSTVCWYCPFILLSLLRATEKEEKKQDVSIQNDACMCKHATLTHKSTRWQNYFIYESWYLPRLNRLMIFLSLNRAEWMLQPGVGQDCCCMLYWHSLKKERLIIKEHFIFMLTWTVAGYTVWGAEELRGCWVEELTWMPWRASCPTLEGRKHM